MSCVHVFTVAVHHFSLRSLLETSISANGDSQMGCLLLKSTEGQGGQRQVVSCLWGMKSQMPALGEDLQLCGSLVNLAPQVQNCRSTESWGRGQTVHYDWLSEAGWTKSCSTASSVLCMVKSIIYYTNR